MSLNDPEDRVFIDNYPDTEIKDIPLLSEKINTLYSRLSNKKSSRATPLIVDNVLLTIQALEYHLNNFHCHVEKALQTHQTSSAGIEVRKNAKIEAIAYLNTLGQLYYWARWVDNSAIPPKLAELTESYRHKVTAHSSSFKLDSRDTEEERELHLQVFSGQLFEKGKLVFQIQKTAGQSIHFDLIEDHVFLESELLNVYNTLLSQTS